MAWCLLTEPTAVINEFSFLSLGHWPVFHLIFWYFICAGSGELELGDELGDAEVVRREGVLEHEAFPLPLHALHHELAQLVSGLHAAVGRDAHEARCVLGFHEELELLEPVAAGFVPERLD